MEEKSMTEKERDEMLYEKFKPYMCKPGEGASLFDD